MGTQTSCFVLTSKCSKAERYGLKELGLVSPFLLCFLKNVTKQVRVEILVLESHDPVAAIAEEIAGTGVTKLVIGMSHPGFFAKKIGMSSMIATAVPRFCSLCCLKEETSFCASFRFRLQRNDKVRKNGERQFHECPSDPDSPSPRAPSSNNHEIANMDWGALVPANYSFVSHQASNMSEVNLSVHSMTDNSQVS